MYRQSYLTRLSLAAMLGTACGEPQDPPTELLAQNLGVDNGLSLNGLSWNGLSWNGLSWNGLSWNGLSWNGLSTNYFTSWFLNQGAGPASSDMIMRYISRCALPSGSSLSATLNGVTYFWPGELGLAPQWSAGNPIPLAEQQLVTACLAAHTNKFGIHVEFSLQGYQSNGAAIPDASHEMQDYAVKEGCFFGNLFTENRIYVGNDSVWAPANSSSRDCAITVAGKANNQCLPMIFAGDCSKICVPDSSHNAYHSCSYQGISYAAINTRITHADIYQCGDHICQISESCGTGDTPDNCKDCGPCR